MSKAGLATASKVGGKELKQQTRGRKRESGREVTRPCHGYSMEVQAIARGGWPDETLLGEEEPKEADSGSSSSQRLS